MKLGSPRYDAVIACVPTERLAVVKLAWPLPLTALVPRVVPASTKATLPVGVPEPGATACTSAVKVAAWPNSVGLEVELSEVVVSD